MKRTQRADRGFSTATHSPAPRRESYLTPDSVRQALKQILHACAQHAPFRESAAAPRDANAAPPEPGATILDTLKRTGDILDEALATGNAAGAVQAGLSELVDPLLAITESRETRKLDALQQTFVKQHGESLERMGSGMDKIADGLRVLSALAAQGAADLDPGGARRILDRMRNLGDATLRQIELKISAAVSRDDRKRLQNLRDEMRNWIAERNARLETAQLAVDELNIRAGLLRKESLIQSSRLARTAEMASRAAGTSHRDPQRSRAEQISSDAAAFSGGLRALLLRARLDITAPLQES